MRLRPADNSAMVSYHGVTPDASNRNHPATKVTIIHTASLLNLRGSEYWVIDASKLLQAESFDVSVVNFNFARLYPKDPREIKTRLGVLNEAFGSGIHLVRLSALSLRLPLRRFWSDTSLEAFVDRRLHFLPLSRRFLKLLHETDATYFVVSQGNTSYLLVVLTMSLLAGRRPVIAGIHVKPRMKASEKPLMKLFARAGVLRAIHVVDKSQSSEFEGIGCKIEYVPNGVFYERFHSNIEEKASQDRFVILFVGAMNETKGAHLIPRIYASLKNRRVEFLFRIFTSGGELAEEIRGWSEDKPDVRYEGFVEREALSKAYADASVAIFPSKREAFPLACLEVQASGTPVAVSNVPGLTQIVIDGINGTVVPRLDPDSFAEALYEMMSMWKLRRDDYLSMCRNAQRNVRDKFQWNHIAKDLASLIRSALSE